MLLQQLREYASRHPDLGPPMYITKPVRYEVALDHDGNPLGIIPLTGDDGQRKDRGMSMLVPHREKNGSAATPVLLTDTVEYALGWSDRPDKAKIYHPAFVEMLRDCAESTGEPGVQAVINYLERPVGDQLPAPDDFDRGSIVTFSVDREYPIDIPSVQHYWASVASPLQETDLSQVPCSVCGQTHPIVRLLPHKIKGVPGGQSSGTALVSTNEPAFDSYQLDGVSNTPICINCADAVCKALNHLLADERTHVRTNPLVYVYWTRDAESAGIGLLLSTPQPEEVRNLINAVRSGRPNALGVNDDAFYCAGLAGSGGRVAVRDWIDTSIAGVQENLARYFELQQMSEPWGGDELRYFGLTALSRSTLRTGAKGTDHPNPNVPRSLLRCALLGTPLPRWMLGQVLKRTRAEQDITHSRAALIKMVLASQSREWRTTMARLNEENTSPAYLCGRLLAVLDQIQRAALGQRNATIIDRYFGTASTAPLSVFARLTRGAQPHLAKLRRDRPTTGRALENQMQQIIDMMDGFPHTLTLEDQGVFVLGYYHQRAADRRAAIDRRESRDSTQHDDHE